MIKSGDIFTREGSNESFALRDECGDGVEGAVFTTDYDGYVAKIYKQPPSDEQIAKLRYMIDHPLVDVISAQHISVAWPAYLVSQNGQIAGYLMPMALGKKKLDQVFDGRPWSHLVCIAANVATAYEQIHKAQCLVCDSKEDNILVTEGDLITIVDADSFQVTEPTPNGDRVFRTDLCTPGFLPPELMHSHLSETDRTRANDNFGLSVLIYKTLMAGVHPFNGAWTGPADDQPTTDEECVQRGHYVHKAQSPVPPKSIVPNINLLSREIQKLFSRSFDQGYRNPAVRPSAGEWRQALDRLADDLVPCPTYPKQHIHRNGIDCPWCDLLRRKPVDGNYFGVKWPPPSILPSKKTVRRFAAVAAMILAFIFIRNQWYIAKADRLASAGNFADAVATVSNTFSFIDFGANKCAARIAGQWNQRRRSLANQGQLKLALGQAETAGAEFAGDPRFHDYTTQTQTEIALLRSRINADAAISALNAGKYTAAMDLYHRQFHSDPHSPDTQRVQKAILAREQELIDRAEVAASLYRWASAIASYQEATVLSGNDHRYQSRIAQLQEYQTRQPDLENLQHATDTAIQAAGTNVAQFAPDEHSAAAKTLQNAKGKYHAIQFQQATGLFVAASDQLKGSVSKAQAAQAEEQARAECAAARDRAINVLQNAVSAVSPLAANENSPWQGVEETRSAVAEADSARTTEQFLKATLRLDKAIPQCNDVLNIANQIYSYQLGFQNAVRFVGGLTAVMNDPQTGPAIQNCLRDAHQARDTETAGAAYHKAIDLVHVFDLRNHLASAKTAAANARKAATDAGAQYADDGLCDGAQSMYDAAQKAENTGTPDSLGKARDLYQAAETAWAAAMQRSTALKTVSERAWTEAILAKSDAEKLEADNLARGSWRLANNLWQEAISLQAEKRYAKASDKWTQATARFTEAATATLPVIKVFCGKDTRIANRQSNDFKVATLGAKDCYTTFQIYNTGKHVLRLTFQDSTHFHCDAKEQNISPGEKIDLTITLMTNETGQFTEDVVLTSKDPKPSVDSTFTITCTGGVENKSTNSDSGFYTPIDSN